MYGPNGFFYVTPCGSGDALVTQDTLTLLYLFSGRLRLTVKGSETAVEAEKLLLLPQGCRFAFMAGGFGHSRAISIALNSAAPFPESREARLWDSFRSEAAQLTVLLPSEKLKARLSALFQSVYDELALRFDFYEQYAEAALEQIIILTLRLLHGDDQEGQRQAVLSAPAYELSLLIKKAIQYIDQNYAEDISLEQIAGVLWVNPSYLSRQFKINVGISFTEFISRKRTYMAKSLLVNSDRTVADIALAVGFRNIPYFNSVFKRDTGLSPRQFRRKHRKSGAGNGDA